jgi:hypothetical protein
MSEQPSVIQQAGDAVSKVAESVAQTLNFGEKEAVGNPGKLVLTIKLCRANDRSAHPLHRREGRIRYRR